MLDYLHVIFGGVFFLGVAALALLASSIEWVSESVAWWISGICIFLFLLLLSKEAKARRRVAKLLSTMAAVYSELRSDGPISAQYIRDRATNTATQEGVAWPAPLFALLDDIISRTGRF